MPQVLSPLQGWLSPSVSQERQPDGLSRDSSLTPPFNKGLVSTSTGKCQAGGLHECGTCVGTQAPMLRRALHLA